MVEFLRHAIVVASTEPEALKAAVAAAEMAGLPVTPIIGSGTFGEHYLRAILIAPDGYPESTEGSKRFASRRRDYRGSLAIFAELGGPGPLQWVEVQFGGTVARAAVVASSDDARMLFPAAATAAAEQVGAESDNPPSDVDALQRASQSVLEAWSKLAAPLTDGGRVAAANDLAQAMRDLRGVLEG